MGEEKTGKAGQGEFICDCPFCGKEVYKAIENEETVGVMHMMPMCEKFMKLRPEEFIHAVYEETLKRLPN